MPVIQMCSNFTQISGHVVQGYVGYRKDRWFAFCFYLIGNKARSFGYRDGPIMQNAIPHVINGSKLLKNIDKIITDVLRGVYRCGKLFDVVCADINFDASKDHLRDGWRRLSVSSESECYGRFDYRKHIYKPPQRFIVGPKALFSLRCFGGRYFVDFAKSAVRTGSVSTHPITAAARSFFNLFFRII